MSQYVKRNVTLLFLIAVIILLAVIFRIKTTGMYYSLENCPFTFYGIFGEEYFRDENEIIEEISDSECIVKVKGSGELKYNGYVSIAGAVIEKVYKGNLSENDIIYVATENGVYNGKNWGMSNLINADYEYLLILNDVGFPNDIYLNDFYYGAIPLFETEDPVYIEVDRQYTYAELVGLDFFATDELNYNRLKAVKKDICELCMGE